MLILIIVAVVCFTGVILAFSKYGDTRKRGLGNSQIKDGLLTIEQYLKVSRFLDDNFLTRKSFMRIKDQISLMSIYDVMEVKVQATKFYCISRFAFWAVVVTGIILFQDIFSVLLVFTFALVIQTTLVEKQLDEIQFKVLKELQVSLSSLRQKYNMTSVIPEALQECDKGELIRRPLEAIHTILVSNESSRRLDEFYASTPFKKLQTLAGVCWFIHDRGDTYDSRGVRNFVVATTMISDEVDLDIRMITRQRKMFGFLEIMPLLPLPAISFVSSYFSALIPGTSVIYNGLYGFCSKITVVLLGIIGYYGISNINRTVTLKEDDRSLYIQSLLQIDSFVEFIDNIRPKRFKKKDRLMRKFKKALSQKRERDYYAEKVVWAASLFLAALFTIFVILNLSKDFIYNNPNSLSLLSVESLTQEDIDKRLEMDAEYLSYTVKPSTVWTQEFVNKNFPKMDNLDKEEQVHRLQTKYDSYYNTVFKWWMLILAYVVALIGWFIPDIGLLARSMMIKVETEDDVLQIQTMLAILLNTSIDTLDTLYWMARQSRIHKSPLVDAHNNFPGDPDGTLKILRNQSISVEFQQMIDKLSDTARDLSLAEAFPDLVAQRDHVMRLRELTKETILLRKRTFCKPLALGSLAALAVLHLLLPIGILGYTEFQKAMQNISL